MKKLLSAVCLALALGTGTSAQAAAYVFDVDYLGGGAAVLAAGSDDPTTIDLVSGDSFTYLLSADPYEYWQVLTGGEAGFFPFFALTMLDGGTRTGNFTLTLLLDGVSQFVYSELGASNSFVHLGTNVVSLPTGLSFDQMSLQYSLLSSDATANRANSLLPWPGSPPESNVFFGGRIALVQNAAQVPEPGSLGLVGLGLAALALSRRRARLL